MYLTKLLGAKQNEIASVPEGWVTHGRVFVPCSRVAGSNPD